MADAKDKPAHVQVAEAGFGAAMIGLGFQKVSRTQWKRSGDRIVWRVAVAQANTYWPGWIEVNYGLEVPGFDDLVMQIIGDRPSERLPGTSARIHYDGSISSDLIGFMREAYEREHPQRTGLKGWLEDRFKGRQPRFSDLPCDIPYYGAIGDDRSSYGSAWVADGNDPTVLAIVLAGHFERHSLPCMDALNDIRAFHELEWGRNCKPKRFHFEMPRFAIASMVGDFDLIDEMAGQLTSDALMTYQENLAKVEARDRTKKKRRDPAKHYSRHEQAVMSHLNSIAGCRVLRIAAKVCGFPFHDPGIDFALLAKAEEQFGDFYPNHTEARRMDAAGIDWTQGYY